MSSTDIDPIPLALEVGGALAKAGTFPAPLVSHLRRAGMGTDRDDAVSAIVRVGPGPLRKIGHPELADRVEEGFNTWPAR